MSTKSFATDVAADVAAALATQEATAAAPDEKSSPEPQAPKRNILGTSALDQALLAAGTAAETPEDGTAPQAATRLHSGAAVAYDPLTPGDSGALAVVLPPQTGTALPAPAGGDAGTAAVMAAVTKTDETTRSTEAAHGAALSIPSDDLFASQWHLRQTGAGLFDLGDLSTIWDDYTGAGVEVAVIDDAVQRTHHQLDDNYSTVKDWDFDNNDTDPSGVNGQNHGTAVAGIIGAARDGVGTVGVAYDSTLFGFQVNGFISNTFVLQLADAINNASGLSQTVGVDRTADVVNMSLGTQFSNNFFDDFLSQADMATLNTAINNAAISGRGGLGTILVKSAGNSRGIDHDANAESWNANIHTISVAAVDQNGFVSFYSTHGSNLLISGFGTPGQVVTTDRLGAEGYNAGANPDFTFGFNGTSAAAPMISGVVALMLEANSSLGWRDVQEILAYSARQVGSEVGAGIAGSEEYAWQFNNADDWNGGGLHFSRDYGFGLVDAFAAVRLAETWGDASRTSANDTIAFEDLINAAETVDGVANGGNTAGTSGTEDYSWTEATNVRIEQITIDIAFDITYMGDIEIVLISPDGTTHQLINDIGEGRALVPDRWTFSTNAFWGEESAGNWTLRLTDDAGGDEWLITDIDVRLHGTAVTSDDVFIVTNEFSDYAGLFGHSTAFSGGSGVNTLNAAAVTSGSLIDLDAGTGTIDGIAITNSNINRVFTGDGNDTIIGDGVSTFIDGGRGNDRITSGSGDETLNGGNGNDTFRYVNGAGADTGEELNGGDGTDTLLLSGAGTFNFGAGVSMFDVNSIEEIEFEADGANVDKTVILGNEELDSSTEFATALVIDGNDTAGSDDTIIINVDAGNNVNISGWTFQDWNTNINNVDRIIINGSASNNNIVGSSQEDSIEGGAGADTLVGGDGGDTLSYASDATGVTVRLFNNTASGGHATGDVISLFRHLTGGTGNDSLAGSALGNIIVGGLGNDTIDGGGSGDTLRGGDGIDTLSYTADSAGVTIRLFNGAANGGQAQGDNIGQFENIVGGSGDDSLVGNGVENAISGGLGRDTIEGGNAADTLRGGGNVDTLSYISDSSGVTVRLFNNTASGGQAAGDDIGEFENVTGGSGSDLLIGSAIVNAIGGGLGNDTVDGGGGGDTLRGGDGTDLLSYAADGAGVTVRLYNNTASGGQATGDNIAQFENLTGGSGNDSLVGSGVGNVIRGGIGNDTIEGGVGADTLAGEGGTGDTLSYEGDGNGVTVRLFNNTTSGGHATGDAISGFENIIGGSRGDALSGSAVANQLSGRAGNDTLTGGGAADDFIFIPNTWDDDTITDFAIGVDTVVIGGGFSSANISLVAQGVHTLATLVPTGDTILFLNRTVAQLNSFADFDFV